MAKPVIRPNRATNRTILILTMVNNILTKHVTKVTITVSINSILT